MRRHAALPVLAGILAVLWAWPAGADDSACSGLAAEAEASVGARWPRLLATVREAFAAREDIDRCARVRLRSRDAAIAVEVVLPDGRFALRSASRPEDVVPTLEALLLLPLPQRDAVVPPPPQSDARSGSRSLTRAQSDIPRAPSPPTPDVPIIRPNPVEYDALPSSVPAPSRFRIELSVATGARIGDDQTSLGLEALSFLDFSGWLVGFEGRLDRYQRLDAFNDWQGSPDGASAALELAVLGGRRVRLDSLAIDFLVGPAGAIQGTSTSQVQTVPRGQAGAQTGGAVLKQSSSSTVPRLLAVCRLNFAAQSTLHAFVGLDGEVGQPRAGGNDLPVAPRLPTWTLGLALGATVGTR